MRKAALTALGALSLTLSASASGWAEPAKPTPLAVIPAGNAVIGAAVYVADLERSLKFYRDTLGMRVLMQFAPSGPSVSASGGGAAAARPDTVLSFGAGPSDPMLMLLSDRNPAGPRKIEHAFGFARVVLRMGDLDALAAKIRANGFVPGEIHGAHGSFRVMMATDPDGYTVEIIEQKPAS
ncbi:MAG: VOC family protein [Novosphingobium sp.]|nr:VOC family protein [Novosphingobium sp.]